MARLRNTVDFFPHYSNSSEGKTLTILTKKYGNDGYAAWYRLLERLANTENHCIVFDGEASMEWIADRLHIDSDKAKEIIDLLAELDAIDQELWQKHNTIWSQHFVDNLAEVYRNRRRDAPVKPTSNVDKDTPNIHPVTPTLHVETSNDERKSYGEFQNVLLSDEEYRKLVDKFGADGVNERVEALSAGIASKGYKYKSFYAAILSWEQKEQKELKQTKKPRDYQGGGGHKRKEHDYLGGKYGHMVRGREIPKPEDYLDPKDM